MDVSDFNPDVNEPCGFGFAELQQLSDEVIMRHLQLGHNDALAVLYERYRRLVFSIALNVLRDIAEAEDLTQVVFLEMHRLCGQFDPLRGTTKVWLLQFAYHRSINQLRRLKRQDFYRSQTSDISDLTESTIVAHLSEIPTQENHRLLREAIENLTPEQVEIIRLAVFEGFTFREISEKSGKSLGNVRHQYYRAIDKLRGIVRRKSSRALLNVEGGTIDAEA